jgi:phenylacetate-CoA ligase
MTTAIAHDTTNLAGILAHAREILALDGRTHEQIVELQQQRLRALLAHAVESSPYYREVLGADAADAQLADLPTLSKPLMMEEFDRIVTDPRLRLADVRTFVAEQEPGDSFLGTYCVFSTSGASGVAGLFIYARDEFAHWIAAGLARLARVGVTGETRFLGIGAPGDRHITRQLFAAFQARRADTPRLSVATPLDELTSALDAYQPEAMIGYASVFAILAQEQLDGRLSIRPRIAVATSEVLTDETFARVQEAWGSPPVNAYAATEAPGLASDSPERVGMHVWEESVLLEVVDDENRPVPTGMPGTKVLLTNLVNRAQPLIRYELPDSVVLAEGPDPSDRPFTRIARVDGRSDDILTFAGRDGHPVRVDPFRLRSPFSTLLEVRGVPRSCSATTGSCSFASWQARTSSSACGERSRRRSSRRAPPRRRSGSSRSTASSATAGLRRS